MFGFISVFDNHITLNIPHAEFLQKLGFINDSKEKWEGIKGPEMLNSVSSSIPQGTKDYISDTQRRLFNPQYLRSPSVFFGLGEEKAFFVEKNPSLLLDRMKHNLKFFYLNYSLVTVLLFVLTILISPKAIVGMGLLGLAWAYVIKATQNEAGGIQVRGFVVSQKQATAAMGIVSALVLFYILNSIFWWTLSTSGLLCGLHIVFRDASMHKDEEDRVPMSGDLTLHVGEDSAFLGGHDLEQPLA